MSFANVLTSVMTLLSQQVSLIIRFSLRLCLFFSKILQKHECPTKLLDKDTSDKNIHWTKLTKFRLGDENFVRQKILSQVFLSNKVCYWTNGDYLNAMSVSIRKLCQISTRRLSKGKYLMGLH